MCNIYAALERRLKNVYNNNFPHPGQVKERLQVNFTSIQS